LRPERAAGLSGAEALDQKRSDEGKARVVSLKIEDKSAIPLGHEPIYLDDDIIGLTTSTAYGFRVDCPVALALLDGPVPDGTKVDVDIAGTKFSATVVLGPLFDPDGSRMRG